MTKRRRKTKSRRAIARGKQRTLDVAVRLHQAGQFLAAQTAYREFIDLNPGHGEAHYLCGVVTRQLERPLDAIEALEAAISLEPDHPQAISELAKLYQQTGQLQKSANALRKLISLRPDLGALYSNLGMVLQRMGQLEEAAVACQKAVQLIPDSAEAHSNLGDVFKSLGRCEQAAEVYRQAIDLSPSATHVYRNLVAVLREHELSAEVLAVLKQWRSYDPDNPVVQHMMAAYGDSESPTRASVDYVRQVFDTFAETFDEDLLKLDYQGPNLISQAVDSEVSEDVRDWVVMDAGCGTGLCGRFLRRRSARLVGVDLSAAMLQRAQELNLYDDLVEADLIEYLNGHPQEFNLIVAADTFNYFGDLQALLVACEKVLKKDGVVVYTLERSEARASVDTYRLNSHGRYSHNVEYVQRCMTECGFEIRGMDAAPLRQERNRAVDGIVVRARKQSHPAVSSG